MDKVSMQFSPERNVKRLITLSVITLSALFSWPVVAIESLTDQDMSDVSGQSGLTSYINSPSLSATSWALDSDVGTASQQGSLLARNISMTPVGASRLNFSTVVDIGSDASTSAVYVSSHLDKARLDIGRVELGGVTTKSLGEWALVSPVDFTLLNTTGLFSNSTATKLYLALSNADFFYRQAWAYHANLTMHNINFIWDMPAGTVAIDSTGLKVAGNVDFQLNFDLMYKFNPDQDLATVTANDKPMLRFGWQGKLWDSEVRIRSGGVWTGSEVSGVIDQSTKTQGINLGLRWNYKQNPATNAVGTNDFRWQVGRAGGNHTLLEFGDWRNLEMSSGPVAGRYGFNFPSITLDMVPAGSTGPGGLCWGASTNGSGCSGVVATNSILQPKLLSFAVGQIANYNTDVNTTTAPALLYLIRDGNLLAYSNKVTVSADSVTSDSYNWGLIYTLGNINSNISMYAGGNESDVAGGSRTTGIMADVLLMTQSFAGSGVGVAQGYNWENGTHFLIADTCTTVSTACPGGNVNMGIGILGASFLLAADDMRIWLKNTWAGTAGSNAYDGGVDLLSPRARMELKGIFGGAKLPGGSAVIRVANIDLNLEGLINFRLSPPPDGSNYLAYSAALRVGTLTDVAGSTLASGKGSFFSIAEPGRVDADLRFANLSGDMALTNGRLEVLSKSETSDAKSHLEISNTVLLGYSASARMTDAVSGSALPTGNQVVYSDIQFGGNTLAKMVIPSGTLKSTIALMPK